MREKSLYEILGVPPAAVLEDVKKAYRALSMSLHPDQGGDVAAFMAVLDAYKVLSDTKARRNYDALLRLTHDVCPGCSGDGVRYRQKGFTGREAYPCVECGGAGFFSRR